MRKIILALLLSLILTPIFARDVEIIVIDADLELPLEGAVILSWDESRHICGTDGKAVINVPENRRVVIHASYPGYRTGRLIITTDTESFTLGLFLSEQLQGRELVIEASKPGENESRTGRSIAVSGQELSQTAKIGAIEDTMASIKLLPGIIATEHFDAMPSIRGGEPQDVNASLDGFYIAYPYFWGGAFSIFDPHMIESAQLSHGVFSARHGRTVSGLLDLKTKKPSPTETELELATDASALRVNLSVPLNGKGGIFFMGRITYIEPIFYLAKLAVNNTDIDDEIKNLVNSINRAPYIRSTTVTGNYNFTDKLELGATVFFGMDGTGLIYKNYSNIDGYDSYEKFLFDYMHYQGFLMSSLTWNPNNDSLVKFTAGAGFQNNIFKQDNQYEIYDKSFSTKFREDYDDLNNLPYVDLTENYLLTENSFINNSELIYNIQGRVDYDRYLGNGFLLAVGAQEMLRQYRVSSSQNMRMENWLAEYNDKEAVIDSMGMSPDDPNRPFMEEYLKEHIKVSSPALFNNNVSGNILFNTSGYGLIEYNSPLGWFGTELGLRVDHYYLKENDIALGTKPVLNPRINLDFNILKDRFIFDSIGLTLGTGLFSSMPNTIIATEGKNDINEIKPTRSWTSILGTKMNFSYGISVNIEGYYKYIYNRMYTPASYDSDGNVSLNHHFNGEGKSWGMDIILQKTRSRFWDGWISYSYNWTQHRDPSAPGGANNFETDLNVPYADNEWYFPYYHRFHSLNLVLNVRPVQHINIFMRFGLASGVQLKKRVWSEPKSVPVYIYDPETNSGKFIEKYIWPEIQDKNNRTTPSLQMDMKVSFFRVNKTGKTRVEGYFALENILSILYFSKGNEVFNPYTGRVATGRTSASYGLPFPIPSFGFNFFF